MKPIFSIWIKTRQTFKTLDERGEKENNLTINLLFFLASMSGGFSYTIDIFKTPGEYYYGLAIAMLACGFMGILFWRFVMSYLVFGIGKIFQGKASISEVRLVLAYSLITNIVLLITQLVLIIPAVILDNKELIGYRHPVTLFILWVFVLRFMVIGLSRFNKYSFLYAILNVLIPAALLQGLAYGLKLLLL